MIIVLNHKSNLTKAEFTKYTEELTNLHHLDEIIICPSYLNIPYLCSRNMVKVGAQNISKFSSGAHTGEISASQLKSYGANYTIVGHSERRNTEKETSEEINQKIKEALKEDIIPILCVGETAEEKRNNMREEIITKELLAALNGLNETDKSKVIIAYEPIWSIGTGLLPSNEEIKNSIDLIKATIPNSFVLYGGSVNEDNIETLQSIKNINGYLIGGMSLSIPKLKLFLDRCNWTD